MFYVEIVQDSPGCELFQRIQQAAGVPFEFQFLVHEGKLVSPNISLLKQGFFMVVQCFC